jgi:hypothetical protein
MSIHQSIKQAQKIVKQLSKQSKHDQKLLRLLTDELKSIADYANTLAIEDSRNHNLKPEMKAGCYVFVDEKGFFCPSCYDRAGQKVLTKRLNSKLRVCPSCRASIHTD